MRSFVICICYDPRRWHGSRREAGLSVPWPLSCAVGCKRVGVCRPERTLIPGAPRLSRAEDVPNAGDKSRDASSQDLIFITPLLRGSIILFHSLEAGLLLFPSRRRCHALLSSLECEPILQMLDVVFVVSRRFHCCCSIIRCFFSYAQE